MVFGETCSSLAASRTVRSKGAPPGPAPGVPAPPATLTSHSSCTSLWDIPGRACPAGVFRRPAEPRSAPGPGGEAGEAGGLARRSFLRRTGAAAGIALGLGVVPGMTSLAHAVGRDEESDVDARGAADARAKDPARPRSDEERRHAARKYR